MRKQRKLFIHLLLLLVGPLACAWMISSAAWAQDQDSETAEEEAADLGRVQITGSRILRTDIEGPTPIVTIDRTDFENQGYLTVQDALDSLTQNTGGSLSQQFVFGFTPGASAVNLRGFGLGRTLTLIDGRRIPVYPLGIGGSTQFFDLSSIPTAIIDRIEILTDGASAIYGSDAVGGVINVITRKDFDGLQSRIRFGDTDDGGYETRQYELVGGASTHSTSAYLTFQFQRNEELLANQRDFAASDIADPLGRGVFSTFGANIVEVDPNTGVPSLIPAPDCGSPNGPLGGQGIPPGTPGSGSLFGGSPCGFNRSEFRQLFPENDRVTFSGRVDHELDNGINLFAFGRWTQSETNTQIEPFAYAGTALFLGASANPIVPNNGGLITGPNGGPAVFVRRLVEYGPRTTDIDIESYGATLGVNGLIGVDWEWEAAYSYNVQEVFRTRGGSIILSAFENEVDNGLDLFQPIPDDVVARTSFQPFTDAQSQNDVFDVQITGFLPWELPGGPVGLAAVGEFEQQEFFDRRDQITLLGDASDGGSAGGGARERTALGLEISLPVIDTVEISAAARWDDYNDESETGSALSPKIAVSWRPLNNLLLRGSWSETFRAPDLQRLFGSTTRSFQTFNDTVVCQNLGGSVGSSLPPSVVNGPNNPYGSGFDPCVQSVQSVRTLSGSNISLEEETGESWNLGLAWNITDDLSMTLDYFNLELENIISTPTGQFIVNQCAAGDQSFCALITRDTAGSLNGGQLTATAQNLSFQETSGADLTVNYVLNTDSAGRFEFESATTWVRDFKTQFNEASPVTSGVGIFSLPEWRSNFTTNWSLGNFGATLRATYVDELGGINSTIPLTNAEVVDDYITFNGQLRYQFGPSTQITFGINNLFNEDPPVDPTNPQWPWFINAGGYYNPVGREFYIQWVQDWN